MTTTPRSALPELAAAQAQKHVTHNEALIQLDALLNARILDRHLAAPPANPTDGDAYLVTANPAGAWAGQSGKIAFAVDGGWRFYAPFIGLTVFVADESAMLVYTANGWVDWSSVVNLQNVPLLGVNTAADAANKFALKANAALFAALEAVNGGTGNMQAKINKETAANTGSILFQTGFSGRAEMGLTGDDDFHIKVSHDAVTWKEAIVVNNATGNVGIGNANPSNMLTAGSFPGQTDALISARQFGNCFEFGHINPSGYRSVIGAESGSGLPFVGFSCALTPNTNTYTTLGQAGTLIRGDLAGGLTIDTVSNINATGQTPTNLVTITSAGKVGIKNAFPVALLDVAGSARLKTYTVATLPSATNAGQLAFVSDAMTAAGSALGAIVAGGGTNFSPVYSDGANWRQL